MAFTALIQLPLNDLSFQGHPLIMMSGHMSWGWGLIHPLHLLGLSPASNPSPMTIAIAIMIHLPRDLTQLLPPLQIEQSAVSIASRIIIILEMTAHIGIANHEAILGNTPNSHLKAPPCIVVVLRADQLVESLHSPGRDLTLVL